MKPQSIDNTSIITLKKPDFVKIAYSCLKIIEEYLNSFFIILLERKYMIKLRLIFFKVYTMFMSKTQLYFEVFRTLQNPFI